ncbi:hypothetical protein HYN48_00740 [Flavobacterium magnum]|uniref:DUF4292 domain-containing protein n=1 Tax=Flavobacterium magnum TaxID=2162713 RepID=A0A2S0RC91_9FLAO|nr:hypothetical protein [Flavobacterium magnum]AWA28731.1 hypothetical protein HYN48_00740 [Flavobacterium magnum]
MKITRLLMGLLVGFALTSCNFTEEIYVNNDGGGKFSIQMDGSQLMAMAGKEMQNDPQAGKVIDSTFSFKDVFAAKKDSIAKLPVAEQERLRKLENYTMAMKMNAAEQQMMFTIATDFKSVAALEDAMSAMTGVTSLGKGMGETNPLAQMGGIGNNNSTLKYAYDGKKFSRKATLLKKETTEVANDSLNEAFSMIYESSTYTVKYHFPKKIKKVSNSAASISSDKKTVTVEYPFTDYMKAPEKLNFDVEFE